MSSSLSRAGEQGILRSAVSRSASAKLVSLPQVITATGVRQGSPTPRAQHWSPLGVLLTWSSGSVLHAHWTVSHLQPGLSALRPVQSLAQISLRNEWVEPGVGVGTAFAFAVLLAKSFCVPISRTTAPGGLLCPNLASKIQCPELVPLVPTHALLFPVLVTLHHPYWQYQNQFCIFFFLPFYICSSLYNAKD